ARAARTLGVHTFTVWAWSTENWERPEMEINEIMKLLRYGLDEMEPELHRDRVRFIHLGSKDRLPKDAVERIKKLEESTANYTDHVFNIALDYGGHAEIVRAINKILDNNLKKIDAKQFESYLDTANQPYPYVDLFIRTSGEQRTSGLLPWQMDYAEYYFEQEHLPDFTPEKLKEAVLDYSRRRRRFGGNDAEEHFKFDPKIVAGLELQWQHALNLKQDEKFRDLVIRYVREHYGLSKTLAKTAGIELAKALVYGRHENWDKARLSLEGLYEIVRKTLGLALEPKIVANIEIDLWKNGVTEEKLKNLLAEKFRVSSFQAAKSAHLGWLASTSDGTDKKGLLEKFYEAIKERVA
ncbi:MAG: polyprenyl diphosphate synthase, partial [Patescibacteria group bacterium]